MTQDVDLMAEEPEGVANALSSFLSAHFPHVMASRVRAVRRNDATIGYRVYQDRSAERGGNRHLADVRKLDVPREYLVTTEDIQYTGPRLTMAMKAAAAAARSNEAKRLQDVADLARLMVALPDVGVNDLRPIWAAIGAPPNAQAVFQEIRNRSGLAPETDEDSFY